MTDSKIRNLFIIDPAIRDFYILAKLASETSQASVFILQPNRKEIEQITCAVQKHVQLSNIHIISQGLPGCLFLGNSRISIHNFNYYIPHLKKWSVSNIFLYGCNIGSEEIGKKFILRLYKTTGANISTLITVGGNHTKVGVGIWTTSQYTLIKPELLASAMV